MIEGLKKVVDGKVKVKPPKADPKLLPNPGLDITYLGSAQQPIEAWVVMTHSALPGTLVDALHQVDIAQAAPQQRHQVDGGSGPIVPRG